MTIDTEAANKMITLGGLLIHWEHYHLMTKVELASYRNDLYRDKDGKENWTRLKMYRAEKNKKIIPTENFDEEGVIAPFCVTVGDEGDFEAIYDEKQFEEIKASKDYVSCVKKLQFVPKKWEIPVYEHFEFRPEIMYIGDYGVYAIEEGSAFGEEDFVTVDAFPCPLVFARKGEDEPGKTKTMPPAEKPKQMPMYDNRSWPKYNGYDGYGDGVYQGGYHFTTATPTKMCCAYDSTEKFLERILGLMLDYSDKSWYVGDERVEANGLPLELTLTVLTELVEPYGVEIDKVWLDGFAWSDEMALFSNLLGFEESPVWRMARDSGLLPEGHREARMITTSKLPEKTPLIVFAKDPTTAWPGGHASYCAPRQTRPADWKMALSFRKKK